MLLSSLAPPALPLGRLTPELPFLLKSPVDRAGEGSAEPLTQDEPGLGLVEEEGAPAGPDVRGPSLEHKRAQLPTAARAGSSESCSALAGRASPGLLWDGDGRETSSLQPGEVGSQRCFRTPFLRVQGMSGFVCCLILRDGRSFALRHAFVGLVLKAILPRSGVPRAVTVATYFLCVSAEYRFLYLTS